MLYAAFPQNQARLQTSETNGRRVQQFIQSIPRTQFIPRNDFSDLGILPPQQQQALSDSVADDVSVISATAAVTVPFAQVRGFLC